MLVPPYLAPCKPLSSNNGLSQTQKPEVAVFALVLWAQAYNMGDGRAASELSRRGREYGELAKQYRQVVNDEVRCHRRGGVR